MLRRLHAHLPTSSEERNGADVLTDCTWLDRDHARDGTDVLENIEAAAMQIHMQVLPLPLPLPPPNPPIGPDCLPSSHRTSQTSPIPIPPIPPTTAPLPPSSSSATTTTNSTWNGSSTKSRPAPVSRFGKTTGSNRNPNANPLPRRPNALWPYAANSSRARTKNTAQRHSAKAIRVMDPIL